MKLLYSRLCLLFMLLVLLLVFAPVARCQETGDSQQPKTILVDATDVPYSDMSPQEQEAYKKRVKSEVVAAVSILCFFALFVFIISIFRFGRNYSKLITLKKKKKTEYVDVWGNPRVQIDDLPTDEEMLGEDTYQ